MLHCYYKLSHVAVKNIFEMLVRNLKFPIPPQLKIRDLKICPEPVEGISVNIGKLCLNFSMNYELPTMNYSATRRSQNFNQTRRGVKKI